MVDRIVGGKGFGPITEALGGRKAGPKQADKAVRGDRVEFSALLQEAGGTNRLDAATETPRSEKVQELKQQIASGQYRPDLEKVAASLLKFIIEEQS